MSATNQAEQGSVSNRRGPNSAKGNVVGAAFAVARQRSSPDARNGTPVSLSGAAALNKLFREQYGSLLRFCRMRIHHRADAEDIVQDAFLSVGRSYPDKAEGELRALLFTTVRNLTTNHQKSGRYRTLKRSVDINGAADMLECRQTPTPESQIAGQQSLLVAGQAISDLPERARTALLLHRHEGLTYQQIADRLSVSATTVKTDIASAVAAVAAQLTKAEGGVP